MPPSKRTTDSRKTAAGTPDETRLDSHIDAPSTVAPGDAPADTTDPNERASTVIPDFAAAALAGHLTVNSAVPIKPADQADEDGKDDHRIEEYEATRPDGTKVTIKHNLDTGESTASA